MGKLINYIANPVFNPFVEEKGPIVKGLSRYR